ncbi:MAG: zinc ribbon domain-containing protein [Acidobacteria bacterium]|nr:zinc ribbon domain-containing protein [Acidobacteriota bacterium]
MKVYCPRCGQEQITPEVRFCSRCGFVMTGMSEIVLTGGVPTHLDPTAPQLPTPRRRGLKQGGAWFLFGVFMVPLLGVLSLLIRFPQEIIGLAAIVFYLGGVVRMLYALMFENGTPGEKTLEENVYHTAQKLMNRKKTAGELPAHQTIPAESYMPPRQSNWRDTNDLQPTSVTDPTTKLLEKEK